MQLSAKSDYALRALFYLADPAAQGPRSIREIAAANDIPRRFLEHIMLDLKAKRWVRSVPGRYGGYALAQDPHSITMGEVVRHFGDILAPVACVSVTKYCRCSQEPQCRFRQIMLSIRNRAAELMDHTTLAMTPPPPVHPAQGAMVFVNPLASRVFEQGFGFREETEGEPTMTNPCNAPRIDKGSCDSVLLALSTFRRSAKAVDAALEYLRPHGRLTLLWVVDMNLARYFVGTDVGLYGELRDRCEADLLREHEQEARRDADAIAARARERGFTVEVKVQVGRFGLVAEELANTLAPQLIVTTRSKRPGWVKRLFGSPVTYLIEHAACPVLDV